jgi:hypothetical protein
MTIYCNVIPKGDEELFLFARNIYDYAMVNFSRWGSVSPEEILKNPVNAFEEAIQICDNPNHSKMDTMNKSNIKRLLVHYLWIYLEEIIVDNSKVTDEDKEYMNISPSD